MPADPRDPSAPCWHCGSSDHRTETHPKPPMTPSQAPEVPRSLSAEYLFLRLWTKAVGTADYDKNEWLRLQKQIEWKDLETIESLREQRKMLTVVLRALLIETAPVENTTRALALACDGARRLLASTSQRGD